MYEILVFFVRESWIVLLHGEKRARNEENIWLMNEENSFAVDFEKKWEKRLKVSNTALLVKALFKSPHSPQSIMLLLLLFLLLEKWGLDLTL